MYSTRSPPQIPSSFMSNVSLTSAGGRTAVSSNGSHNFMMMPSAHEEPLKPRVTHYKSPKDVMTEMMRNMHKDRVVRQIQAKFEAHSELFNIKPDYGSIFTKKFSSYCEEDELKLDQQAQGDS